METDFCSLAKVSFNKAIENLEERLKSIRAGRANPNMLDNVMVSYYGVPTPVKQLATIFVPEARTINIKPFDKNCLSAIEKAIFEANLGVTPNNNGEMVFITIPELTEERRKELVKQAKIAVRNIRKEILEKIKAAKLPEDLEKTTTDKIQDIVNDYNKKIEELVKEKEKDLMQI